MKKILSSFIFVLNKNGSREEMSNPTEQCERTCFIVKLPDINEEKGKYQTMKNEHICHFLVDVQVLVKVVAIVG